MVVSHLAKKNSLCNAYQESMTKFRNYVTIKMATSIWGTLIFSLCSSDCGSDCSAFSERFTVVWRIQVAVLMNLC